MRRRIRIYADRAPALVARVLLPRAVWALGLAGTLAAGAASAQAPSASGRCGTCHPRERVMFERSLHAGEEVRCVSCHGGDDRSLEISVAHGRGFRGRIPRTEIPRMCAGCHSDEQKMRGYNLPVDQYALYQTSGHGRRLAAGDTRVAVCSDCHGAHDVLPPADPTSRIYLLNIPRTCGACHGDSTLMAGQRRRSNVYREYLDSIHAHELFDRGNQTAPTCVSCHGVHGAAPPEVGDIDKVCGQCHGQERRYFAAGPHRKGLIEAGKSECASCHGYHAVQRSDPQRLARVCADCHGSGSPEERQGQKLAAEYQAAATELEQAAELIGQADRVPLRTDDYRARLEQGRTYLREALPSAHSVQEEVVDGFTSRARAVGAEIRSEIFGQLGNLRVRKFVLIVFWFYVIVTIVLLRRFQRAARRS